MGVENGGALALVNASASERRCWKRKSASCCVCNVGFEMGSPEKRACGDGATRIGPGKVGIWGHGTDPSSQAPSIPYRACSEVERGKRSCAVAFCGCEGGGVEGKVSLVMPSPTSREALRFDVNMALNMSLLPERCCCATGEGGCKDAVEVELELDEGARRGMAKRGAGVFWSG